MFLAFFQFISMYLSILFILFCERYLELPKCKYVWASGSCLQHISSFTYIAATRFPFSISFCIEFRCTYFPNIISVQHQNRFRLLFQENTCFLIHQISFDLLQRWGKKFNLLRDRYLNFKKKCYVIRHFPHKIAEFVDKGWH